MPVMMMSIETSAPRAFTGTGERVRDIVRLHHRFPRLRFRRFPLGRIGLPHVGRLPGFP